MQTVATWFDSLGYDYTHLIKGCPNYVQLVLKRVASALLVMAAACAVAYLLPNLWIVFCNPWIVGPLGIVLILTMYWSQDLAMVRVGFYGLAIVVGLSLAPTLFYYCYWLNAGPCVLASFIITAAIFS